MTKTEEFLHLLFSAKQFVFNLTAAEDAEALSPLTSGSLRLEMRFRVPLPQTTTLIVYSCFDSILEIKLF